MVREKTVLYATIIILNKLLLRHKTIVNTFWLGSEPHVSRFRHACAWSQSSKYRESRAQPQRIIFVTRFKIFFFSSACVCHILCERLENRHFRKKTPTSNTTLRVGVKQEPGHTDHREKPKQNSNVRTSTRCRWKLIQIQINSLSTSCRFFFWFFFVFTFYIFIEKPPWVFGNRRENVSELTSAGRKCFAIRAESS